MGRRFCDRVFNFDPGCISGTGAYVKLVNQLALMADRAGDITGGRDFIDRAAGEGWLEYTIGGKSRRWKVEQQSDRADMLVIAYVMDDLERGGLKFRARDNGQRMILCCLDDAAALKLGTLLKKPLTNVVVH